MAKEATPEATAQPSALAAALLDFQSKAPALQKDAINPHFKSKYVPLENVLPAVLPILNEVGLVLIQQPSVFAAGGVPPEPALTTSLLHPESGESINSTMLLMLDKDNPQGQGSAITYARRYSVMSILGLVADTDDDANAATAGAEKKPPARRRKAADKPAEAAAEPAEAKADGDETPF